MFKVKLFLIASFLSVFIPVSSWASQCLICHSAMKGRMEGRKGFVVDVHINAEKFQGSVHGSLECTECHVTYSASPHTAPAGNLSPEVSELVPFTSLKSKSDPVALAACVRCHPDAFAALKASVHGENVFKKKQTDGPLCLDCHGVPHYITPKSDPGSAVNHANAIHTCGSCHEKKEIIEKYSLTEHLIERYKESFHGKKYVLGHKRVPICNDCHGGHAITKAEAPDSAVAGMGKVKTCGKCHTGATMKFAAAPAHKHIGKDNPIPYYGEKGLILLLLGTFAFITSHVVLEALAEIRDKYFRKKEGHDE